MLPAVELFEPRPDVVVAMTDPPVVGFVAWLIARLKRAPFVYIVQDLYPDVAVALGRIRGRLLVGVLERASRFLLRRADGLVAISGSMKARMAGKGVPADLIERLSAAAHAGLAPDRTFVFDCSYEVSQKRLAGKKLDRFEREDRAFFERVHTGYRAIAAAEPKRVRVIDATRPIEEVSADVWSAVAPLV